MSPNPNLEERVAALERQVAAQRIATLQPNILTDVGGQIGVQLSGALKLQEATQNQFEAPNAVQWVNAAGNLQEYIEGVDAGAGEHRIQMAVVKGDGSADFSSELLVGRSATGGTQIDRVQASALGGGAVTLINGIGQSSFLRWIALQSLNVQLAIVVAAVPVGWSTVTVFLPQAFPSTVTYAMYAIAPANGASINASELGPSIGAFNDRVLVDVNSTVAQNIDLGVLAFGH